MWAERSPRTSPRGHRSRAGHSQADFAQWPDPPGSLPHFQCASPIPLPRTVSFLPASIISQPVHVYTGRYKCHVTVIYVYVTSQCTYFFISFKTRFVRLKYLFPIKKTVENIHVYKSSSSSSSSSYSSVFIMTWRDPFNRRSGPEFTLTSLHL